MTPYLRAPVLLASLCLGGCLAASPPQPTGRPYRLIVAGWNGQAVTVEPRRRAIPCELGAGGRTARFWITPAPARAKAPPTVLTARESELLDGISVRCESWAPRPRPGIAGPIRRSHPVPDRSDRQTVVRPLSRADIAAGRIAIEAPTPPAYDLFRSRFRLDLRVEPFLPPPPPSGT